jgi:hypothetical protein
MEGRLLVLMVFLGMLPAVVSAVQGWQARKPRRKLVLEAIPKGWFAVILFALVLPHASMGARVAIVIGVLLATCGLWIDLRDYRRQKRAESTRS